MDALQSTDAAGEASKERTSAPAPPTGKKGKHRKDNTDEGSSKGISLSPSKLKQRQQQVSSSNSNFAASSYSKDTPSSGSPSSSPQVNAATAATPSPKSEQQVASTAASERTEQRGEESETAAVKRGKTAQLPSSSNDAAPAATTKEKKKEASTGAEPAVAAAAEAAATAEERRDGEKSKALAAETAVEVIPPAPPRFGIGQLTKHNVFQIKELNLATLPVQYCDSLYEDLPRNNTRFSRLAYMGEAMVGAICCRVEPPEDNTSKKFRLYMMTLGVLKPYRKYGVASRLLAYVLTRASEGAQQQQQQALCCCVEGTSPVELSHCYLHVWTANDSARRFYEKRGFSVIAREENYYVDVYPTSAYVLTTPLPWKYANHIYALPDESEYDVTLHNLLKSPLPSAAAAVRNLSTTKAQAAR